MANHFEFAVNIQAVSHSNLWDSMAPRGTPPTANIVVALNMAKGLAHRKNCYLALMANNKTNTPKQTNKKHTQQKQTNNTNKQKQTTQRNDRFDTGPLCIQWFSEYNIIHVS